MLVSTLIERTYNEFLYPSGINRPTYDKLALAMDGSQTTLTVTGRVQNIPRDTVLEIDSELMLVDSVTGTTVTLHPTAGIGRGYLETAATTHLQFAPIYIDPTFSRQALFNTLLSMIGTLYPQGVYCRKLDSSVLYDARGPFTLPATGLQTIAITVAESKSSPIRYNQLRKGIDYLEFDEFSPPKIQLLRGGIFGGEMHVVYKTDFTLPTSEAEDLSALANPVPLRIQNYLPMAVAGYLLQGRELSRTHIEQIVRALNAQGIQVGSAMNVANQMLNIFYARYVQPEADRLREQDSQGIEFVRR